MRSLAMVLLFIATTAVAHADIYGYIDAAGMTHLATEKIDDQYTLFLKTSPEADRPSAGDRPVLSPDASLMKTRLFQRLVDHPNIRKYEPMIRAAAARHGLDPGLVKAVIAVESGFEPAAVSDKGAVGLMQILPATGERYGVHADRRKTIDAKLADPTLNIEIGTRYLADLRKMFANRPELALAAYNAGENAVVRFRNAIPPFSETRAYVKLVAQFHAFYRPPDAVADALARERIRVMIPARRNMPDPNMPMRLAAPEAPVGSVVVPAAIRPAVDAVASPD
ncbi:MAG: lytic transglycosylase domain-containing protein [Burkholderiaceae bacterium]